jgi:hypothetical protein
MKKALIYAGHTVLILILLLVYSCAKDPDTEILESWYVSFENETGIRIFPGEDVRAVIRVTNDRNSFEGVRVRFEIVSGGGGLSSYEDQVDPTGKAETTWTPGNLSLNSTLRAWVLNEQGERILYRDLNVKTFIDDEWNPVTDSPDGRMMDLAADTVAGVTFMVTNSTLFRQGERYYLWEKTEHTFLEQPRTIETDSNGAIYVSTWKGEIVKSSDHGFNWVRCTKPYPEDPYFINMWVSSDNYIWVWKHEYPVKVSKDGGLTWITVPQDLSQYGFGRVYRLENGDLIMHGSNCCSLLISSDDGMSWTHIPTPGHSTRVYVDHLGRIFLLTQENGITFYSLNPGNSQFTRIHSVYPQWGSTWENNHFIRWKNFWYVVVPGSGIYKTDDMIHFQSYWNNSDIRDLFVDHNGVLIAKDWDWNTVYYRRNTEEK